MGSLIISVILSERSNDMADLLSCREFTQGFRKLKVGQSVIVVDAVTKRIVNSFQVIESPEEVVKVIKRIYSK
jgi:hypothetical protein